MQFNVILNRKGEKVLTINGFKPKDSDNLEGYGSENDSNNAKEEEDNTLFINLNKVLEKQNNSNSMLLNDVSQITRKHDQEDLLNSSHHGNDFLTQNPVTRVIESFPNKLNAQMAAQVEVADEIGSGAHAKVYQASYLLSPVALKIYNNTNPLSLNAFNTELEAYFIRSAGLN